MTSEAGIASMLHLTFYSGKSRPRSMPIGFQEPGKTSYYTDMESKLIAVYARVSTLRQEEEGTIKTQLSALREYARTNGYVIVKEYVDDGWSGDMLARPALDDLRQAAKSKLWNAVLIYDPDRLARRYSFQELVMDELHEANIDVMFVTVAAPKNAEDKILHGVRGLFAEYERAKISERFRLGKLRKVREGHILTSEALYGYRYIPKKGSEHGYYEVNEDEAKVVRMIFSWVGDQGYTQRKIVRKLHEMNIKPRRSRRGVWMTSTLSTLLRHKAYIGEAHWGKSYAVVAENPTSMKQYRKTKKTSRRNRPEAEWVKIPVPAIIDRNLFDRARAQLERNAALCQRNKKNEYLLAGLIGCICGRTRSGEGPMQGKHLYYRCTDRVLSAPLPPKCKERSVNARIADRLVWEQIASLMSSPQLMRAQIARWLDSTQRKTKPASEEREVLRTELARLREMEHRYNNAYGAGVFSVEQLRRYTEPIRVRVSESEGRLRRLDEQLLEPTMVLEPTKPELEEFARRSREKLANLKFRQKRAIVLKTIEKVLGDQKNLTIYGHIPVTENVDVCTSDRHGWNTNQHTATSLIPFEFTIALPHPLKERVITSRNEKGRIIRSAPPEERISI
jgi:site-specific DNA recombinase